MITEQPDYDLRLLMNRFVEYGDYTKEVILDELLYWQNRPDFLCLVNTCSGSIAGFLIAYRDRNSLWISQVYRETGSDLATSMDAFKYAKKWARNRGMTSITGETKRNEIRAMERYGFREYSINMRIEL